MVTIPIPTMVTIKEAAGLTGLSYNCIRKMCINKEIVHIKAGNKFLINLEKLIEKLNGEVDQENEESKILGAAPEEDGRVSGAVSGL